jgi:hypothetical protein
MVGAIQEQQEEVNPKDFVTGSNLTVDTFSLGIGWKAIPSMWQY